MATIRNKGALVARCPAFQSASPETVKRLASACEVRKADRHAPIWSEGDTDAGPVLVRTGVVREVFAQGSRALTLGLYGRGDLVGAETALGLPTGGALDAYEDCLFLQFPVEVLATVARTDVAVAHALARLEAQRRLDLQVRCRAIAQHSAPQRLADSLLALGRRFGVRDSRGITVNLRLTHAELAALIGATRETVSFLVSDFRRDGLIERDGKRVVILDRKGLARLAAGDAPAA